MSNNFHEETEHFLHTVAGLLNFLGGAFDTDSLKERSFAVVADAIIRNGGKISVGVVENRTEKTFHSEEF